MIFFLWRRHLFSTVYFIDAVPFIGRDHEPDHRRKQTRGNLFAPSFKTGAFRSSFTFLLDVFWGRLSSFLLLSPRLFATFSVCFTQWLVLTASPRASKLSFYVQFIIQIISTAIIDILIEAFCLCTHEDATKLTGFQFSRALNLCPTQFIVH